MSTRIHDVVILGTDVLACADRNAQKIVRFLGVDAIVIPIDRATLSAQTSIASMVPRCRCLIVSADTLAEIADGIARSTANLSDLTSGIASHVFVYGFHASERHHAILRTLSSNAWRGVERPSTEDATFHVAERSREWCGQFSGLSLAGVDAMRDQRFVGGPCDPASDQLISIGDGPFFVRLERKDTQLFLLACTEIADLDETVRHHARPVPWFSRLIPLMMFLRGALGDAVWHSDCPRACLVIDDPLLKRRYGFLNYRQLVDAMRRQKFTTSIAFIPLNYRRSRPDVAALVASNANATSLCVHGCDHTDGEFAVSELAFLQASARLALERMQAHHQLSGVPFDDVMVFPQGRFSAEAIAAIKATGYLATVNGDVAPTNASESSTLRNWLEVAVTKFGGFPLFSRRYPRDIAEFAFDLFMGKPAVAVEHHGYFKSGYGEVESFVQQLNALDERLEWSNLSTICSRACLIRTTTTHEALVRFYTNRFTLLNTGADTRQYFLFKNLPSDDSPVSVTIDGRPTAFERAGDDLLIPVAVDGGRTVDIAVSSPPRGDNVAGWPISITYGARVRARRILGEFRDDYVDTTRALLNRWAARALGRKPRRRALSSRREIGNQSQLAASILVERSARGALQTHKGTNLG